MPEIAINFEDGQYTILGDGIIAWRVLEEDALAALYERFPDAPPAELVGLLQEPCAPAVWRTQFANAMAAEAARIHGDLSTNEEVAAELQNDLTRQAEEQSKMSAQLKELKRNRAEAALQDAEDAFEFEVERLAQIFVAEHGDFTEAAYRKIAKHHLIDMFHPAYGRLLTARGNHELLQ